MIELKDSHVFFNKGTKIENYVLKGINLKVSCGEFITIIGGNGAGKSTLMNVLAGDVKLSKGKILLDQQNVTNWSTEQRAKFISRVYQNPIIGTFSDLTIEENMSIAYKRGKARGLSLSINTVIRDKFREALSEMEMGLEDRLIDRVSLLSGGQRQALSLIMATLIDSKILLLDEHTSSLDPKIAKKIMRLTDKIIKKYKLTTLMITHSMSQALEYGDRTIMLYHGKIEKDMPKESRKKLSAKDLIKYFDL